MNFPVKSTATVFLLFLGLLTACKKEMQPTGNNQQEALKAGGQLHGHLKQTNTYSAEVVIKWMDMQIRLMTATTGVANVAFTRPYAYSGIALYETVVPGMPAYQTLGWQLAAMPAMPKTDHGYAYHWPAAANAALAYMNRHFFQSASSANKVAIDSLENALETQFRTEENSAVMARSIAFGKEVAQKVFDWSEGDGYLHASDDYTVPMGPGLWVPPSIPVPKTSTPYWGALRIFVSGSGDNAQPGPPVAYSENPSSGFYQMVKQVYDVSQMLTPSQTAMALYWRDVPGVTTPGHYASILRQVLEKEKSTLDRAAIAYAVSGITAYDASVSCWQTKYHYNLVRPVTYIRNVLGHPTWSSLIATPAHPEYSSAHAVLSAAVAEAFTTVFGDNYSFTDHTYDYLNMSPRSFVSFRAFGEEAGASRLYAGIHYQPSIDAGLKQGRKVAQNVSMTLRFLKE